KRITDQTVLVEIAKNDSDWYVRGAAMERVTDQAVLTETAKSDSDWYVRRVAMERIADPKLLPKIADNHFYEDEDVRRSKVKLIVIEHITDQAILMEIAKNDSDIHIREAAAQRITDQKTL